MAQWVKYQLLISAQVFISGSWDPALRGLALGTEPCLRFSLCISLCPFSHSPFFKNKQWTQLRLVYITAFLSTPLRLSNSPVPTLPRTGNLSPAFYYFLSRWLVLDTETREIVSDVTDGNEQLSVVRYSPGESHPYPGPRPVPGPSLSE